MLLSAVTAFSVISSVLIPTVGAFAADLTPAGFDLEKTQNMVHPGDDTDDRGVTFNWILKPTCSYTEDECVDAVLTDVIPPEFIPPTADQILITPEMVDSERTITVTGNTVEVKFHKPLLNNPIGEFGLPGGSHTVTIPVTVRSDLAYTPTSRTVENTAQISGKNAPTVTATDSVDLTVPLELSTGASKSFSPSTNIAVEALTTQLTLEGKNTSNAPVSTLTIQDPATIPSAETLFKNALKLTSLDSVVWPAGATEAVVSVWDASPAPPGTAGWVDAAPVTYPDALVLPTTVEPHGVKVVFTSGGTESIARDATATVEFDLENRAGVVEDSYPNTVQSTVEGYGQSATDTSSATYVVSAASSTVLAGKSISPHRMSTVQFDSNHDRTRATVTLSGENTGSVALKSMTVSEPSDPTSTDPTTNPFIAPPVNPENYITFDGLKNSGVTWPDGADGASITYYYSAPVSTQVETMTEGDPIPVADTPADVTGFSITFTSTLPAGMGSGAKTTLPFYIKSNSDQTAVSVDYPNEVKVNGVSVYGDTSDDTDTDTVTVLGEQVNLTTSKSFTRNSLRASPGQSTIATLTTQILDYPESTRELARVEMIDPSTETGVTDWYRYFNATEIVATPVPVNTTLTVWYRNLSGDYTQLTVLSHGDTHYSIPGTIPDDIYGLKLVWESTTGFPPGQKLFANIKYDLRSTLRGTGTPGTNLPNEDVPTSSTDPDLKNCSASTGESVVGGGSALSASLVVSDPCPKVELVKTDTESGSGGTNFLNKNFNKTLMTTRSSEQTRAQLSWSTAGYTGVDSMVIYDGAVDSSGQVADESAWNLGMYDAFNLTRIERITNSLDPLLKYDQVAIQLYNKTTGAWENVSTTSSTKCTVAVPCGVSTPNYAITDAQQETTVAVKFIFTEGPNRNAPGTGAGPAPGSGVADSTGHNRRIRLHYEMRDTLRSNSDPVVDGYEYNNGAPASEEHSEVRNDALATATLKVGDPLTDSASDTVQLQDPELKVNIVKTWDGGPVAIPQASEVRPTSRVKLVATNETPARVDSLTIKEPNKDSGSSLQGDPFENWDLARFHDIHHPAGATNLTVTVAGTTLSESGTVADVKSQVLLWSTAQLANATGFTFEYTGNIEAASASTIEFDLKLRTSTRTGAGVIGPGPVTDNNSTQATVSDNRWNRTDSTFEDITLSAFDEADIQLDSTDISVSTSKTFAKPIETEPAQSVFQLTLGATPGGSERVKELTITDDTATFWNAFDFMGTPAHRPVLPPFNPSSAADAAVIQVQVCIGSTWTASSVNGAPAGDCASRGGHWVGDDAANWKTETQVQTEFLPTSFLPGSFIVGNVEGLRVKIKRADDSQWENPYAPNVRIPILVQRRDNLRTGDPVLSDMSGNAASPGEPSAGTTTNTVHTDVVGIWNSTAEADNHATYRYKHEPSRVEVKKGPSGVKDPGRILNYTLTVKNTGSWPIVNPVITDKLPPGALLIFDPDRPVTYTYALTGAAPSPPNGQALPTGTSGPTVDVVMDGGGVGPEQIQFTFDGGTGTDPVLEVGQTYTITIPMRFRPGVVHGTEVENSFSVRGDRPFDSCATPSGSSFSASYDSSTGECSTITKVYPTQEPALRALMTVKANTDATYSDLGFEDVGPGVDCPALAAGNDGFSRLPCVPRTLPGQTETWRVTAQNTGTTSMPRLVLTTRLPDTGDHTIVKNLVRGSEWRPGFADQIDSNLGNADADMRVFYTTASSPCNGVLHDPSDLDACGTTGDPATGWAPWTQGALSDPTVVTGLQFVIDFEPGSLFKPSDIVTIDIVTRTAALSATPGADTTANNSVSASARSLKGTDESDVTAFDASLVSVALATGGVRLEKTFTGPAASHVPDDQVFTGKLVCTSLTETLERDYTMTGDSTTNPPTVPAATITDLPGGAECHATETTASGQTTYATTTVTVDPLITDPQALPTVTLTNDYQFTGLTVSKTVTTTAGVIPTQFEFTVTCTFLGVAVPLAAPDASFTLDDTESHTITGIPVNSNCIVTEVDSKGAQETVMTASTDSVNNAGSGVVVDDTNRTATFTRLSPNSGSTVTNTANADNRFDADAALIIEKKLFGDGAAQFGQDKTFTIDVLCTNPTTADQYDGSVQLNTGNAWRVTLENIIAGSDCTFTEDGLQGADAVVITPNDGTDVTVGTLEVPERTPADPSPVVNIDVNNWYLTGSVQVTKVFAGDAGAIDKFARNPVPEIEFEFTLACERDGENVTIPGGETRTVTAAAPVAEYTGLASRADCVLTETERGGASATRILDTNGDPVVDGEFTITVDSTVLAAADQAQPDLDVENTYRFADVSAFKAVIHPPAGSTISAIEFEVTLTCTLDGRVIEPAEPSAATIHDQETVNWTELAEGADCIVTETDTGGATKTTTTLTQADGSIGSSAPGTAVALLPLRWTGDSAPNQVGFVNSFELAYTGSAVSWPTRIWVPFSLLGGGLLLVWFVTTRRRRGVDPPQHE